MGGTRSLGAETVIDRSYTLAEQTARVLRERILSGQLSQGERLIETRIADELGVSRGPVRDAIKILRSEGLVSSEPHMGASVVRLTAEDIAHVYEIRCAIEAQAARKVVSRADPSDLEELKHAYGRLMRAAKKDDRAGFARLDLAFHETVCLLSDNPRLLAIFRSLTALVRPLQRAEHETFYPDLMELAREHELLINALGSGDPAAARDAFEEHVNMAQANVVAYLKGLSADETAGRRDGSTNP